MQQSVVVIMILSSNINAKVHKNPPLGFAAESPQKLLHNLDKYILWLTWTLRYSRASLVKCLLENESQRITTVGKSLLIHVMKK